MVYNVINEATFYAMSHLPAPVVEAGMRLYERTSDLFSASGSPGAEGCTDLQAGLIAAGIVGGAVGIAAGARYLVNRATGGNIEQIIDQHR